MMTNMTLAIPAELVKIMKRYKDIRWSEVAREAMWDKAKKLELMDKLLANSKLTEEDAIEIGRKVNAAIAKRHGLK
jgi:hypothetical protein